MGHARAACCAEAGLSLPSLWSGFLEAAPIKACRVVWLILCALQTHTIFSVFLALHCPLPVSTVGLSSPSTTLLVDITVLNTGGDIACNSI